MLQTKHFLNPSTSSDNKPNHEYQDVVVFNNSTGDTAPVPLIYNQTKLTNVIDKSNDYYVSVVRWSADSILPQVIPEMQLNTSSSPQPYTGLTNYIIGIKSSTGQEISTYINYKPSKNFTNDYPQPQFVPTSQTEYYNNPYFWIGNIYEFCEMVNESLKFLIAWNTLVPAPIEPPLQLDPAPKSFPILNYNTALGKLELLMPQAEYGIQAVGGVPQFSIFFNTALYNVLNTFSTQSFEKSFIPVIFNDGTAPYPHEFITTTIHTVRPFYDFGRNSFNINEGTSNPVIDVLTQTNSSIPSMSPVVSIVFQTTSIPVNNTLTGAPAFLGPNLQGNNALENNSGVLTDFQVPLTTGTEYSGSMLYYVPTSEYRLLDLVSNGPTQVLNIIVFWLDQLGLYHPYLIKNQGSASLKLMFRKKTFNGID